MNEFDEYRKTLKRQGYMLITFMVWIFAIFSIKNMILCAFIFKYVFLPDPTIGHFLYFLLFASASVFFAYQHIKARKEKQNYNIE